MSKISFGASIAYTKNGNPYEKSRTWTLVGTGVGVAGAGAYWYEFSKNKEIAENLKNATQQAKKVQKQFNALFMGIILCSGALTGIITDYFVNKGKQRASDEAVQYYNN